MFQKMRDWFRSPELQAEFKELGHYVSHITKLQSQKFKKERRHKEMEFETNE